MKKTVFLFILFVGFFTFSCSENDDVDDVFSGINDNRLIAGGWIMTGFDIVELETDNQTAVDMIVEEYQHQIGEIVAFSENGTYTSSGSFFEVPSKYKLLDNILTFERGKTVKVNFGDDTFFYEDDYTDSFQWLLQQTFMSNHKNADVSKAIIRKTYKRVTN